MTKSLETTAGGADVWRVNVQHQVTQF